MNYHNGDPHRRVVRVRKKVRIDPETGGRSSSYEESLRPLNDILDREDERTREVVAERDAVETVRRREELLRDLSAIIRDLDMEASLVEEKLERFQGMREAVAAGPEGMPTERLGEVKKALRDAHMELVKHHRDSLAAENVAAGIDWPSLSPGQLTKIGLGLGWPLLFGLVLGAAIVSATLVAVFGVQ